MMSPVSSDATTTIDDRQSVQTIATNVLQCLHPLHDLIASLRKDERYKLYQLDMKRINEIESQVDHYEQRLGKCISEKNLTELTSLLSDIFYRFHASFIQMRKPR